MQVCNLKSAKLGGAPGEFTFQPISDAATLAGWSVDSLKIAVVAGESKPVNITYVQPSVPLAGSAAAFGHPEFVEMILEGVAKGGLPAPASSMGRQYRIKVRVWVNPVQSPTPQAPVDPPAKGQKK